MAKLFNRAKMTTSTTGTGTITLGSAATGFQSFADAGVANSDVVQYVIEEGANFEIGTGTYTSSGTTLSRTPTESSNSDNAISLAGNATVSITAVAADMNRLQHNGSDKVTVSSTGVSVTGNISVTGTVDGRDIATDGSKLDGIESGATADQTAAEIRSLVESATDSNVFTDADHTKLNGIASGAEVNVPTNLGSGTAASSVSITSSTGSNTSISAATTSAAGVMSSADKTKLDGIESGATADQTITAGSGLTGGGTGNVTISHSDTSTQSSVNNSGRTYIQDITLDGFGHVTGISSATETVTDTNTTYSAGSGLSLSGTTFSHSDTSSQASVNNSGRTYIQDITLDTYGHITGITSATETVTNTDTTYSAGSGLDLSGTTFSVESDLRDGIQYVGYDSGDYIQWSNNTWFRVVVNGSERARVESDGDFHADGNVIAYSTTISDPRLKDNVQKVNGALDKIKRLNGYTFTYKADGVESAGVMSTEVKDVLPSAVKQSKLPLKTDDDTVYEIVQYDQLTALFIEAIKELKAEIEELKNGSAN